MTTRTESFPRFLTPNLIPDADVICRFMEPDAPENGGRPGIDALQKYSPLGWWRYSLLACNWKQPIFDRCPEVEKLGRLREVEAKLTNSQRQHYCVLIFHFCCTEARTGNPIEDLLTKNRWAMIHADAPTKLRCLAAVLRERSGE